MEFTLEISEDEIKRIMLNDFSDNSEDVEDVLKNVFGLGLAVIELVDEGHIHVDNKVIMRADYICHKHKTGTQNSMQN